MKIYRLSPVAASCLSFVLAACGGGGDEPTASPDAVAAPTASSSTPLALHAASPASHMTMRDRAWQDLQNAASANRAAGEDPSARMQALAVLTLAPKLGPAQFTSYRYTVNDLGPNAVSPHAINASGQASGNGWLYNGSTLTSVPCPLAGGQLVDAIAINAAGVVAGWCSGDPVGQGVVVTPVGGSWTVGPNMPDGTLSSISTLTGINDSNLSVGYIEAQDLTSLALELTPNAQFVNLGNFSAPYAYANGVNNAGTVVAVSVVPGPLTSTKVGNVAGWVDIGSLGGTFTNGLAINDKGWTAGISTTAANSYHAFLNNGSTMRDLGTLPNATATDMVHAYALSNNGWVVGASTAGTSLRGIVYDGANLFDLNGALVSSLPAGVTIDAAFGINDSGQILAETISPQQNAHTAVILSPFVTGTGTILAVRADGLSRTGVTYYVTVGGIAGAAVQVVVAPGATRTGTLQVGHRIDYAGTPNGTGTSVKATTVTVS